MSNTQEKIILKYLNRNHQPNKDRPEASAQPNNDRSSQAKASAQPLPDITDLDKPIPCPTSGKQLSDSPASVDSVTTELADLS